MLRLCVLLWARDGHEADLHRYEDTVLALLAGHRGRVIERSRVEEHGPDDPIEVQILEFESHAAMEGYMGDPRRTAMHHERDAAIADTQILRLAPRT